MKTKGKPIVYQDKTLVMVDYFPVTFGDSLRFTFESCNGEWSQGACLRVLDGGNLVIMGEHLKHAVCWRDTAPSNFDVYLTGDVTSVAVYNVWDTGNGAIDAWHNGAAMIVEEIPNGRRYRCNDGVADDDFDDVVFRLERVLSSEDKGSGCVLHD